VQGNEIKELDVPVCEDVTPFVLESDVAYDVTPGSR
jgi:hypothetical protein